MAEEEAQVEVAPAETSADWDHKLLGCLENKGLCCKTMFCPCMIFGKTAEIGLGESYRKYCLCIMFAPVYNLYLAVDTRRRLREKKGIPGSCCPGDLCTTAICGLCTLIQEAQEVGVAEADNVVAPAAEGESMARE